MNPYHTFIANIIRLTDEGKKLPLGGMTPPPPVTLAADAPVVLIFSPHPDDECIIGGLALRLMRESGMRVINVAVTQGSNRERQAARWQELTDACNWLGFGLEATGPHGLERINPKARLADPAAWNESVKVIAAKLSKFQPRVILFPHQTDWNSSHEGVHYLIMDALKTLPPDFHCFLAETEFWRPMGDPNLMVELSVADTGDLLAALSYHVGEVARNPYHLSMAAWLQDNVRRGAEVVGGQGGAAPDFKLATLYKIHQWQGGRTVPLPSFRSQISIRDNPGELFVQR
jgi:LmbE family N-acetylglucosaminyl deacetylase